MRLQEAEKLAREQMRQQESRLEKIIHIERILRGLGTLNVGDQLIADAMLSLARRLNYSFWDGKNE